MRRSEAKAAVEVAVAPGRGLPRHPHHRSQRRSEKPAGGERDDDKDDGGEDERARQCELPRLLVGREGDAGDDGSGARAAGHDRHGVETRVGRGKVEIPRRSAGERGCGAADRHRCARLLERTAAREDPDVGVCGGLVRGLANTQLSVRHVQGGERRCGAGADEVARVTVERPAENEVEAGNERDKCDADREEDGDKQTPPEPELVHENR